MINDEVAVSKQDNTPTSQDRIDVALLLAATLAAQFVTGGFRPATWTWLQLPAVVAIVLAFYLHFRLQRPSSSSPTAQLWIRGHMLIVLALCIFVVGARAGFPIASYAQAPANQMHGVLRERVTFVCAILAAFATIFPILSRTARLSSVFWLTFALNLVLASSTGFMLHNQAFLLFRIR